MSDVRLLVWLRWRQARGTVLYWLRLAGVEPNAEGAMERFYLLYLLVIAAGWLTLVWSYATFRADALGRALSPSEAYGIEALIPWVVVSGAVLLTVANLQSCPFKLSPNDMMYIGCSPYPRYLLVALAFGGALARAAVVALPSAALLSFVIARAVGVGPYPAVYQAAAAGLLVAVILAALSWIVGLAPVASYFPGRAFLLWLAPVGLIVLAAVPFGPALWPGRVLALSLHGAATLPDFVLLVVMAMASLAGVHRLAARTNGVAVAEVGSGMAWGWTFGRRLVLPRAERGGTRPRPAPRSPFPSLPDSSGIGVLLARSALYCARRPGRMALTALQVAGLSYAGAWVIASQAPLQVWSAWLVFAAIVPPHGLTDAFRSDLDEPFLRQLLPQDNLSLFLADVAVPFAISALALALLLAAQPVVLNFEPMVVASSLLIAALLAFSRAVGTVRVAWFPVRLRYPLLTFFSLGSLVAVSILANAPAVAPLAGVVCLLVLALGLRGSPPFAGSSE